MRAWSYYLPFVSSILLAFQGESFGQGLAPDLAAKQMSVAEDLRMELVACEPTVRQPVCIEFDDRGRLWVIQYLQYPNPEGLQRTQVDRYSRTRYDRIPEPPPHGPRGADRITILEDKDQDGRMESSKDFASELNLATGLAFGHGGVFVLNVPYLLFYPDRNRDDIPDRDPEVLLTGFGMEDAHSVANSLTWGPDGWLYGCQGSTVTANIRGIEFQQGVWRYHPLTKDFELFCEGGGNSWGLDFDRDGNLVYSTNYGGFVLVHGVQGGYAVKSFAKHGELHNRFTYGYYEHTPHKNFQGGHVTVGGIVYHGNNLPEQYRGAYLAGDLLGHAAYWHKLHDRGSSFRSETVGRLFQSNDTWFAPTDLTTGPDGAVYIADWHDARTAHPDPDAQWDRSNGRIYRLSSQTRLDRELPTDFANRTDAELLALLSHANSWHVRKARSELVHRSSSKILSSLLDVACTSSSEDLARESLWTAMSILGPSPQPEFPIDDDRIRALLSSPHAVVRSWTIRWLGDRRILSDSIAHSLDELAEREPNSRVRLQLACSCARFAAHQALPIINANINRDVDLADPYIPLAWWWSIEKHCISGRDEVMRRFLRPTLWKSKLGCEFLLPKLIRRYSAEGTPESLDSVVQLLATAPDDRARSMLWDAVAGGLQEVDRANRTDFGRVLAQHPLRRLIETQTAAIPAIELLQMQSLLRLSLTLDLPQPRQHLLETLCDSSTPEKDRLTGFEILSNYPSNSDVTRLLALLQNTKSSAAIRLATLRVLSKLDDPRIADELLIQLRNPLEPSHRALMLDILLSRKESATLWLQQVDAGLLPKDSAKLEQIRLVANLGDVELDRLVSKHWGRMRSSTPEEKLAEVRRLNNDLRAGPGNWEAGKGLFKKHCSSCHRFQNDGNSVGPDLTTANRSDREFLLISLVDPSLVVRKEYVTTIVRTKDDRVITGIAEPQNSSELRIRTNRGETVSIANEEIADVMESGVSLMPEELYRVMQPQELRDLFAYLQTR